MLRNRSCFSSVSPKARHNSSLDEALTRTIFFFGNCKLSNALILVPKSNCCWPSLSGSHSMIRRCEAGGLLFWRTCEPREVRLAAEGLRLRRVFLAMKCHIGLENVIQESMPVGGSGWFVGSTRTAQPEDSSGG